MEHLEIGVLFTVQYPVQVLCVCQKDHKHSKLKLSDVVLMTLMEFHLDTD